MLRQLERSTIHVLAKRGKSQRQIARELGLSRVTVARALAEPVDQKSAKRQRSSTVDSYRERIKQWLQEGLSTVRMLELVRGDDKQPYAGGRSVFGEYVRRLRLEQEQALADVAVRFEGLPGEYLQVDWGEVRRFPFTQQPPATRYFLACRLKFSRWSWTRWTMRMDEETLIRGLVDCFLLLGWVPWVLVFDNMKTVTLGRAAQGQPIWNPVFLQFAREFDFHPEVCAVGAGNQKGSVESLVKWVKGNFLPGRSFVDDADLTSQNGDWLAAANKRPNAATGEAPLVRLPDEAAKGSGLPAAAHDYGFPVSAQVTASSLVHVAGNSYSVPMEHRGAPVTVRLHRDRVLIWRDMARLTEHGRAPDSAHQRIVVPEHFAPLFAKKRRAQTMLYREALLGLGASAVTYVGELSRRRRERLGEEVAALYALYGQYGSQPLLAAMVQAQQAAIYGADYLTLLLAAPAEAASALTLPATPAQADIDRQLSSYEAWVSVDDLPGDDGLLASMPTSRTAVEVRR
jgi:transposase